VTSDDASLGFGAAFIRCGSPIEQPDRSLRSFRRSQRDRFYERL